MKRIVILAAGKGNRMNCNLPKVLVNLKGKPMIEYLVKSCIESEIDYSPIIVVSTDNKKLINKALADYNCEYVVQKKQLGTANALSCAKKSIGKTANNIICFYGDHPFISANTIKKIANCHNGIITMMTTKVNNFNKWRKNFYQWGRVVRVNGQVKEIVEFRDSSEKIKKIKEVNPAIYCFKNDWLWKNLKKIDNNNAQKEYYLTDLIKLSFKQNSHVNTFFLNPKEAIGINNLEELKAAEALI